jgi:WD40 repeat protein
MRSVCSPSTVQSREQVRIRHECICGFIVRTTHWGHPLPRHSAVKYKNEHEAHAHAWIAAGGADSSLRIWDADTGTRVHVCTLHDASEDFHPVHAEIFDPLSPRFCMKMHARMLCVTCAV